MSTATLNPLATGVDAWDRITIAGVDFKGKVEVSGEGIKIKNDHRSARGTNGGRSTSAGKDTAKFKVLLGCFEESHFLQLDAIIQRLIGNGENRQERRHAIEIYHPALDQLGIALALLDEISLMEPTGPGGLFTQEFQFREFHPAPPRARNVTTTPTTPPQGQQRPPTPRIEAIPNGVTIRPISAPQRAPARTPPPSQSGGSNP